MRLKRNQICDCGSGLKYKKCCMNKDSQSSKEEANIPLDSIISFIRFGLENLDALEGSDKKVRVKEISIINIDTLQCQFYSYSENSIDIKVEIVTIMGFFNGFFKDDSFANVDFKHYAVRAYDQTDKELLYALSSKKTAQLLGEGNSIEWLKSTLFQENTNDYRLGIAKRIISEVENTIRHVVKDILSRQFDCDWWNQALNNKLGQSIKYTYSNQFGEETSNGDILINYTYLLDLKKIISTHWPYFKHLFDNKTDFENSIIQLNKIRREEAHNRNISEIHLVELNKLHISILSKIAELYPKVISTYLIGNWRLKIKTIMNDSYKPLYKDNEIVNEPNPILKLNKSINSTNHIIEYLDNTLCKLKSVVVPIQKRLLHDELIEIFETYKDLQEKKLENVTSGEFEDLLNTIKLIEQKETQMNNFANKFLLSEA